MQDAIALEKIFVTLWVVVKVPMPQGEVQGLEAGATLWSAGRDDAMGMFDKFDPTLADILQVKVLL